MPLNNHMPLGNLFAVLILSLCVASTSYAQSRPKLGEVNDRLVRVENILDQSLLNLLQQIQMLEREVRFLKGEIESQANDIARLKSRQAGSSDDLQIRIKELEARLDEVTSGALPVELPIGNPDGTNGDASRASDPADETAQARRDVGGADASEASASDEETVAYRGAYDLLEAGRYDESIADFEAFLDRYPTSPFADNALYWQAEAMYAQRSFDEAIVNFNVLIESFKQSPKVPDAKLKIGFALYEQSRFKDARAMLETVTNEYSDRAAAVLARKRLSQMDSRGL